MAHWDTFDQYEHANYDTHAHVRNSVFYKLYFYGRLENRRMNPDSQYRRMVKPMTLTRMQSKARNLDELKEMLDAKKRKKKGSRSSGSSLSGFVPSSPVRKKRFKKRTKKRKTRSSSASSQASSSSSKKSRFKSTLKAFVTDNPEKFKNKYAKSKSILFLQPEHDADDDVNFPMPVCNGIRRVCAYPDKRRRYQKYKNASEKDEYRFDVKHDPVVLNMKDTVQHYMTRDK